ncbi:DUF2786 domain-containing protein [Thiothrix subterranea]|uniref:DUF2786 domain-containing protein n=1 Tax=Thiothrix subterranea TaxID=2735563 RepID=UPI00280BC54A|nr:DUF2786 domain-containing protein [Thiothrix subterranea]
MEANHILNKIKKCLALAASDNPGEAAAALRQAKKLMDKHGITEAHVKLAEVKSVQTGKIPPAKDRATKLVVIIGDAFACKPLIRSKEGITFFEFIGKGHYPELAAYTYAILWRRLEMERAAFHEQLLASLTDPGWDLRESHDQRRKKWAADDARKATTAFCAGWLARVAETVRHFAGHQPDQDLDDWARNQYGKLGHAKPANITALTPTGYKPGWRRFRA